MKYEEGQKLKITSHHSTGNSALGEHGFEIGTEVEVEEVFAESVNYPTHYEVRNIEDEEETYFVAEDDLEEIE